MNYLFIDSATACLVVAIASEEEIKYIYKQKHEKDTSAIIMPKIKEAFDQTNLKPKDINTIFVTTGPGSFTGIRVGLTIAKTMAYALNTNLIPLSSLEVIASTAISDNNLALIDARRGFVYAGAYTKDLVNTFKDQYIKLDDINIDAIPISYDEIAQIKPKIDIVKIINKHKNDTPINPHTLKPNYLKNTEAEEKKKEGKI